MAGPAGACAGKAGVAGVLSAGRVPEPARSLALSGPERGGGVGWDLPNLSPKADGAHALGALCSFGRGFKGGTRERDWSLAGPQRAAWDGPARLGSGREGV